VYKVELCSLKYDPVAGTVLLLELTSSRADMHASYVSLTLPPLRGSRGAFFFLLWLGARHIKGGGRELGGTGVLGSPRRRNNDQWRAPSDIPLAAAGAAGRLPALSQLGIVIYPYSSRSYRTAISPRLTSIAIKRQMLDFFFSFSSFSSNKGLI
jgi:hypothetical protein